MPREPDRAIDPAAVSTARQRMLSNRTEREAQRILDSLCDPTRLKIVRALERTELAASDLAHVIGRTRSGTSQHLRVLRELGAVETTRQGNIVRYRLAQAEAALILRDASRAFDRLEDGTAAE